MDLNKVRKTAGTAQKMGNQAINATQNLIRKQENSDDGRGLLDDAFFLDSMLLNKAFTTRVLNHNAESGKDELICRAFIAESAGYSVSNNWDGGGGFLSSLIDMLGGVITSSTGKYLAEMFAEIAGGGDLGEAVQLISSKATQLTNSHIFSKNKMIKQFSGSTTKVNGFDNIKLILISDSDKTNIMTSIAKLNQVAIGKFQKINELLEIGESDVTKKIDNFLAIQNSPNGYEADLSKGVGPDVIRKGTLKLQVGELFTLDNLVIENIDVNFSTRRVLLQDAEGNVTVAKGRPYSAEVDLSFTYSSMITSEDLASMFNVRGV